MKGRILRPFPVLFKSPFMHSCVATSMFRSCFGKVSINYMRMPPGKVTTVKRMNDKCFIPNMDNTRHTGTGPKGSDCSRIITNGNNSVQFLALKSVVRLQEGNVFESNWVQVNVN